MILAAGGWDVEPTKFGDTIRLEIAKEMEKNALFIFGKLIQLTPVRTGSLRASWRISVDGFDESVTIGGSPESPLPPPPVPGSLNVTPEKVICISNNVPYAGIVNDGTSKQAPAHMVEVALASVPSK